VAVYLLGGLTLLNHFGQSELLRSEVVGWFLAYQVLGVVMFGSIFVAVGAACNEIKDAQSYLLPVILVLVFPVMIWFRLVEEPMSRFATILSLVPCGRRCSCRCASPPPPPCRSGSPSSACSARSPPPARPRGLAAASSAWGC
jgi:ABC-type Na+ efflux pump permease subunit